MSLKTLGEKMRKVGAAKPIEAPAQEVELVVVKNPKKGEPVRAREQEIFDVKSVTNGIYQGKTVKKHTIKKPTFTTFMECLESDDIRRAVEVHREAMSAESRVWNLETKSWIVTPDHKTRCAAGAFIIANREGLPVQRQIQLTAEIGKLDDALAMLKGSPEAMRAIEALSQEGVKDAPGEKAG